MLAANSQPATAGRRTDTSEVDAWRYNLRRKVLEGVEDFVATRCKRDLNGPGLDAIGDILVTFVSGGKCLRSTFMYLGWLCGCPPSEAAVTAAASLELLHSFALIQDDVMDSAAERRGRPAVHVQVADWHRARRLSGSASRFGESAAILLGDLCLIWAEQMLRESGIEPERLQRVWPRYDTMRAELALGQFDDLASDSRDLPPLQAVLDIARRKSGSYTVRRPLEIGAAMAGCDSRTLSQLGRYGESVGQAFQLRDDVLGVFGSPATTGKPNGGDLLEHKATSVVVTAYQMADAATRHRLVELMNSEHLDDAALERFRTLIVATGAVDRVEEMISEHISAARNELNDMAVNDFVRNALDGMATASARRCE
jgi:geranylgeranyl diphosphate synthase type I